MPEVLTVVAGASRLTCGIGGNDSSNDVPNDEDGLNGLIPPNPVGCGFRVEDDGVEVTITVCWLENGAVSLLCGTI